MDEERLIEIINSRIRPLKEGQDKIVVDGKDEFQAQSERMDKIEERLDFLDRFRTEDKPTIKVPENLSELTPTEILEAARKEIEEKPKDSEAICFNCEQFCVDDPLCPNLMVKKLAQVNLKPKDSEPKSVKLSALRKSENLHYELLQEIERLKSELEKCNQANQIWWTEEERKLSNIIEKALEYLEGKRTLGVLSIKTIMEILEGKSIPHKNKLGENHESNI